MASAWSFAVVVILLEYSGGSHAFSSCATPLLPNSQQTFSFHQNNQRPSTLSTSLLRMCQDKDGTTPKTGNQRKFDPLGDIKDMIANLDGIVDDVRVCVGETEGESERERVKSWVHSNVLTLWHAYAVREQAHGQW